MKTLLYFFIVVCLILYFIPLKPYVDKIRNTQKDLLFKGGLVVLDRDTAVDSIYIDANLKVIDCITTKK